VTDDLIDLDFADGIGDDSDGMPAGINLTPDTASSDEARIAAFGAQGPIHKQLADEILAVRAERVAAEEARAAFATTEEQAVAADDPIALVLGETVQEAFARRMASLDDETFTANWQKALDQGTKDRADGGLGWTSDGPRGALDAIEQAILQSHLAAREKDPQRVLEAVVAERQEAFDAQLRANPGQALALGLVEDPASKHFVKAQPLAFSAHDLAPDAWDALKKALKGEPFILPAGFTPSEWRQTVARYAFGGTG
jgi:hypothetical protein